MTQITHRVRACSAAAGGCRISGWVVSDGRLDWHRPQPTLRQVAFSSACTDPPLPVKCGGSNGAGETRQGQTEEGHGRVFHERSAVTTVERGPFCQRVRQTTIPAVCLDFAATASQAQSSSRHESREAVASCVRVCWVLGRCGVCRSADAAPTGSTARCGLWWSTAAGRWC